MHNRLRHDVYVNHNLLNIISEENYLRHFNSTDAAQVKKRGGDIEVYYLLAMMSW